MSKPLPTDICGHENCRKPYSEHVERDGKAYCSQLSATIQGRTFTPISKQEPQPIATWDNKPWPKPTESFLSEVVLSFCKWWGSFDEYAVRAFPEAFEQWLNDRDDSEAGFKYKVDFDALLMLARLADQSDHTPEPTYEERYNRALLIIQSVQDQLKECKKRALKAEAELDR